MTEPLEARLRRLQQERDEADRRYNDALSQLDAAIPRAPGVADPLPPVDERQLPTLNEAWNTLPAPPQASGVAGRLTGLIWRTVAPYLQRQLTFNSVLVDHLNRTNEALKAGHHRDIENVAALRAQLDALNGFHARLMLYLQRITEYVDTKDRHSGGGALVLNAAISDLADAQAKYRESLEAREHRYDARVSALSAAHEDLRGMVGVAQHAVASLRRVVERLDAVPGPGSDVGLTPSEGSGSDVGLSPSGRAATQPFAPSLDAYKYVAFEDQFRGSQEETRARQVSYLPFFEHLVSGAAPVLDVGCGRGEFIDLLISRNISARGVDLNHEMAESCRARGLDVAHGDAVGFLEGIADESLGGIFAAQVVEHLEPSYLLRLLDLTFQKLRPDGVLVLETLNPACWTAFFESYIRDITHRWPLHPETLKYLVTASGFTRAEIEFRSPVAPQDRLQTIAVPTGDVSLAAAEAVEAFNANVEKLNARLFTYMDYAVVARQGAIRRE
jgi:SAM-dependent methyltransferase